MGFPANNLQAAQAVQTLDEKIAALEGLQAIFAGLQEESQDNPHLQRQCQAIAGVKSQVIALRETPHLTEADIAAGLAEIETQLPELGAGASTLRDWGLAP